MEDVLQSMQQPNRFEVVTDDVEPQQDTLPNIEPPICEMPNIYNFAEYARSEHLSVASSKKSQNKKIRKRLQKFTNNLIKQSMKSRLRTLYGNENSDFTKSLFYDFDEIIQEQEFSNADLTKIQLVLHDEASKRFSADEFLIAIVAENIQLIPGLNVIREADLSRFLTSFKATCLPYSNIIMNTTRTIKASDEELNNILKEEKDYTWDIIKLFLGLLAAAIPGLMGDPKINVPSSKIFRPIPFKEPLPTGDS